MFSIFHVSIRSSKSNNNKHSVLKSWWHKITKARAQTAMWTIEQFTVCSKNAFTTRFCSTTYAVVKRQRKSSLSIITGWQILMNSSVETSFVSIFNKKSNKRTKAQIEKSGILAKYILFVEIGACSWWKTSSSLVFLQFPSIRLWEQADFVSQSLFYPHLARYSPSIIATP